MPSFILINPTVWPQYTNVTDRQTFLHVARKIGRGGLVDNLISALTVITSRFVDSSNYYERTFLLLNNLVACECQSPAKKSFDCYTSEVVESAVELLTTYRQLDTLVL